MSNPRINPRAWQPSLGAWLTPGGVRFRVWAPTIERVELVLESRSGLEAPVRLSKEQDGTHTADVPGAAAGDRYRYRLDGAGPFPDPASRAQPDGVYGPSLVVDAVFPWTDESWRGRELSELVIYELHVGTFTPEGTFQGVITRLPYLADLGVTTIELMPVADFAGDRNWGYDGVALFAPARCYGTPDDLRQLVDAAHAHGLAILLDVVYNHLGPDGAYHGQFSPFYHSRTHTSPWGPALNFDGEHARHVRAFFIENALHWLHEYHVDGLRLDATHAIADSGTPHFLAELAARVRVAAPRESILLIAEDERNLAQIVRPPQDDGWGLDAVWADDLHHHLRRRVTGDSDGYFADFSGEINDIATTLSRGWFYTGQMSGYQERPRGSDPSGIPLSRMVVCLQNHDQVGNRAFGDRLHHQIDPALFRALTVLICCAPESPLLFMGQEWAATTPFLFFTHHHDELGRQVTQGRRREFGRFAAFADPANQARIPDPQAVTTWQRSRLDWTEGDHPPHAKVYALYAALLRLRRTDPRLRSPIVSGSTVAGAVGDSAILLRRGSDSTGGLLVVCYLGEGTATLSVPTTADRRRLWRTVLTTEDPPFTVDAAPIAVSTTTGAPHLTFQRAGAVVLDSTRRADDDG